MMGDLLGSPRVAPLFIFFSLHNSPLPYFSSPFHSYYAVLSFSNIRILKKQQKTIFDFLLISLICFSISCVFFYFLIVFPFFFNFSLSIFLSFSLISKVSNFLFFSKRKKMLFFLIFIWFFFIFFKLSPIIQLILRPHLCSYLMMLHQYSLNPLPDGCDHTSTKAPDPIRTPKLSVLGRE